MLARTFGADALGLDGFVVTIEAASESGETDLAVIGQVDGALVESGRRVVAAIAGVGVVLGRVLVLVGPADQHKSSRGLDLGLACALLVARGVVPAAALERVLAFGEVGPGGEIVACAGALSAAETARREGFSALVLPRGCVSEASVIAGLELIVVEDLARLIAHLRGEARAVVVATPRAAGEPGPAIVGVDSPLARLALEVMLVGGHHLVIHGPPGSGRSAIAAGLVSVPSELELDDAITLTKIHGLVQATALRTTPSVRRPARHAGLAELLGSGEPVRPGELSLAHLGVLVLEDLHTLPATTLAALRLALIDREVDLDGRRTRVRLPAQARLLATIVDSTRPAIGLRAMLDRFDLLVATPCRERSIVPPAATPERLASAVARQRARLRRGGWRWNAAVPFTAGTRLFGPLTQDAARLLVVASLDGIEQHRVCRVAATLADLADQPTIDEQAVRLALALRSVESRIALGIEEERRKPVAHRVREGLQDAEIGVEPSVEDSE